VTRTKQHSEKAKAWLQVMIRTTKPLGVTTLDYPIWWSGFMGVLRFKQTASSDDNPYMNSGDERDAYKAYRAGARAAQSLLNNVEVT
jgi:hypothetical protein